MAKKIKDAKKTGLLVGFVMNLIALLIIAILNLPATAQIAIVAVVLFVFFLPAITEEARENKRA